MIVSCKSLGKELSILEKVVIDVVVDELPQLANHADIRRRSHDGNLRRGNDDKIKCGGCYNGLAM